MNSRQIDQVVFNCQLYLERGQFFSGDCGPKAYKYMRDFGMDHFEAEYHAVLLTGENSAGRQSGFLHIGSTHWG